MGYQRQSLPSAAKWTIRRRFGGDIDFLRHSLLTNRRVFLALLKATRHLFWSRSKESALIFLARRARGAAKRPNAVFPPSRIPVIVARDRSGATIDAVLPKLDRASITGALGGVVTPANQFCCDGGKAIVAFARKAGIPHHVLPAPGKPSPDAPDLHINNVNAYHGRLKEWMRRFHGVATKNLPNYLGWRRALEALGPRAKPEDWLLGAAGLGPYQRLTP